MNLTEREKWLMQQAWDNAIDFHGNFEHWLGCSDTGMESIESHLSIQAPKPDSLVKKVDADKYRDWNKYVTHWQSLPKPTQRKSKYAINECAEGGDENLRT